MAKIVAPMLALVIEENGENVEYTIQTDNRDVIRYDLMRGKKGWPSVQDAPMLWMTFLAWSAMSREKKLPGQNVENELDLILSIAPVDEEGNEVGLDDEAIYADPTQQTI